MKNKPAGIYIHIPFCSSKCSYCNFYSIVNPSSSVIHNYNTCLCDEITRTLREYSKSDYNISSVYLGGGTPNILPLNELEKLIRHLEDKFDLSLNEIKEVTIEVNPNLSDLNYFKKLKDLGFNRISVGVQSLNNGILMLMGRKHTKEDVFNCLDYLSTAGFTNISIDLMFNYPTQTEEDVLDAIKTLSHYPINHFSVYSLSVEPKTILANQLENKKIKLNREDNERKIYYHINSTLKHLGFNHYEISNYAKLGYESRQNNLYWKQGRYFGFGPAASSFLGNTRIDRPANLKAYMNKDPIPEENIFSLSERELKEEFMFLGLRRLEGINDSDYQKRYNSSFFTDFRDPINRLLENKTISINQDNIKLTPLGLDFADRVSLEFLL